MSDFSFSPLIWHNKNGYLSRCKPVNGKAVTLAFCSIQYHFIRDIRAKFGISLAPVSRYWEKTQTGTFNCHNSRTSHDIDMKFGPVTKLDKRNTTSKRKNKKTWQWRHVGKLWRRCHFFDLWPIWSNPEAGFWTSGL